MAVSEQEWAQIRAIYAPRTPSPLGPRERATLSNEDFIRLLDAELAEIQWQQYQRGERKWF